ncbi:MAG TPA: hypothetical protein VFF36_16570, partial [Planctomycetota bacterium]|nr:hypothetical protein [Planctomycetota bacterium]
MARLRLHEALEDTAQHVGRDGTIAAFLRDEVEALEEIVEGIAPDGIRQVRGPLLLQRVRREQAAVEKWDVPEPSRRRRTDVQRAVERAEEERPQQVAVQAAPARQAVVHGARQEVGATVEPALALHEIEEEHAGELKQGQRMAIGRGGAGRQRLGESGEHAAELPEEPRAERFDGHRVGEARKRVEGVGVAEGRQSLQHRQRHGIGPLERNGEPRCVGGRGHDGQPSPRHVEAQDARRST